MPKLPTISGDDVVVALKKIGYEKVRQKGSHMVIQKKENKKTKTVVVPAHKELTKGTLRSIIRQAGLTVDEFVNLLGE